MGKDTGLYTVDELLEDGRKEFTKKLRDGWGLWKFDVENRVLVHQRPSRDGYWLDFDGLEKGDEYHRIILHLAHKSWITPTDLGNFIRAIEAIRLHEALEGPLDG